MAEESKQDRELIELLNELRVALPGVQVLFAFLLAVPFTQRFGRITELQKYTFFVSLLSTTLGSALLIAPSAYHRLRFREHDNEHLLLVSNRLAIAGTVFLALAMTTAVALVTDMIFGGFVVAVVAGVPAAAFAWFLDGLPLLREVRD